MGPWFSCCRVMNDGSLAIKFEIGYWGDVSKMNIGIFRVYRQYKTRVCKECHMVLRTFDGCHDCTNSYIRYIRDDPSVVFAEDFELVESVFRSSNRNCASST